MPSVTARRVAAYRLGFDRVVAPYGDAAADQALAWDVAAGEAVRQDGWMAAHLRARTAFVDRVVVDALASGIGQVVVIGAGYDGRAFRYARPSVRWFEVDRPDTQADKRERIARLRLDTVNLHFVAVDLAGDGLRPALIEAGLDPTAPSLTICEGVAVYLDASVLEALFGELRGVSPAGSRIAATFSSSSDVPGHAERRRAFAAAVQALGEPVRSGLGAEEAGRLLRSLGWTPLDLGERRHRSGFVLAEPTVPEPPVDVKAQRPAPPDPLRTPRRVAPAAGVAAPEPAHTGEPAGVDDLSLAALLSQVLVAFTIEFDNEFEHRMPLRTTGAGSDGLRGPWAVSKVMFSNLLRFIDEGGTPVADLQDAIAMTNLAGLLRWGYLREAGGTLTTTRAGRTAIGVWTPLADLVEQRWQTRHGRRLADLRQALVTVAQRVDRFDGTPSWASLPHCLPVVAVATTGARTQIPATGPRTAADQGGHVDLSVLLARTLIAFTVAAERDSAVGMPVAENTLRVLTDTGVRIRDLPRLTGVSREANAMSTGLLCRYGFADVVADPNAFRGKVVRLTEAGQRARHRHQWRVADVEQRWSDHVGPTAIAALREGLAGLLREQDGQVPALTPGLAPYPQGWRARDPYRRHTEAVLAHPTACLPRHPMVLHRGGWPDGA